MMNRNSDSHGETSRSDSNEPSPAEGQQSNHAAVGSAEFIAQLKRRLEETRLPAGLKEQILANLPPPEERERLLRELQKNGGLSSEEFFASLGLEVQP
jgi:hypothetical protein